MERKLVGGSTLGNKHWVSHASNTWKSKNKVRSSFTDEPFVLLTLDPHDIFLLGKYFFNPLAPAYFEAKIDSFWAVSKLTHGAPIHRHTGRTPGNVYAIYTICKFL